MVHHYLENHGLHSANIHLNADNCSGQNKNNAVIQYLAWRVLVGKNQSIRISFLPTGHTKFSPDWCFGLLKQRYRRTYVGSLDDIIRVVNESATVNIAQPIGTTDGEVYVRTYDWTGYLAPFFRRIKSIKTYHHFYLEQATLGRGDILLKENNESTVTIWKHLRQTSVTTTDDLPTIVTSNGLSAERQWYLFEKIREYCPHDSRDRTCPLPTVPKPSSSRNTPEPLPLSPEHVPNTAAEIEIPQAKKRRICSKCGQSGHNSRTCK